MCAMGVQRGTKITYPESLYGNLLIKCLSGSFRLRNVGQLYKIIPNHWGFFFFSPFYSNFCQASGLSFFIFVSDMRRPKGIRVLVP